jgi:LysM repeat protein
MKTLTLLPLCFLAFSAPLLASSQEQRISNLEQEISSLRSKVASISERLGTSDQTTPRGTSSASESGYRIRKGDTFWGIAKSCGISISALQKANPGLNPSRLKIGKPLRIPRASKSRSSYSDPTSSYATKSGDTLGEIAIRHGTSLSKLMDSNPGLNPRKLQIGQEIKIPGSVRNTVASKPAPESGQRVAEASGPPPPPRITAAATSPTHSSGPELVTVSQNRRLDDIARFYSTDVPTINSLNQVSLSPAQVIKMGSQIYIPQQ